MKIGPKYKIARRLGAPVFEKTQTQKFALSESKKERPRGRGRQATDYGLQLKEKQKARYFYTMQEKQFSKLVKKAMDQQADSPIKVLFKDLELRLDSVVNRAGFGSSRLFSRQLISHGHIMVNDKKLTVASHSLKPGDVVKFKPASLKKGLAEGLDERIQGSQSPSWLKVDLKNKAVEVVKDPDKDEVDLLFDLNSVLEFYSR